MSIMLIYIIYAYNYFYKNEIPITKNGSILPRTKYFKFILNTLINK